MVHDSKEFQYMWLFSHLLRSLGNSEKNCFIMINFFSPHFHSCGMLTFPALTQLDNTRHQHQIKWKKKRKLSDHSNHLLDWSWMDLTTDLFAMCLITQQIMMF